MEVYILSIAGILVSVLLFVLGYRQTIGARRERIRAANTEIEKSLLKRIVLESYKPSVQDLSRLIEAKARDYKLRASELYSESQVMNTIFTRIIETDFISSDKRNEMLELLAPIFTRAEEKPVEETAVIQLASEKQREKVRTSLSLLMGIVASLLGAFGVFSYSIIESREWMLSTVFITVAISFVVITLILFIYRFREPQQEETTAAGALKSYMDFEHEVGRVLKKAGVKYLLAGADRGYDFRTEIRGKKILIEVKAWSRRVPLSMLGHLVAQLNRALVAERADEAVIVTKEPVEFPPQILDGTKVMLMTLNELRNYIVHEGSK
jgi:hypothetical protein